MDTNYKYIPKWCGYEACRASDAAFYLFRHLLALNIISPTTFDRVVYGIGV